MFKVQGSILMVHGTLFIVHFLHLRAPCSRFGGGVRRSRSS